LKILNRGKKRFIRIIAVVFGGLALSLGLVDYFCVDLFGGTFVPVTGTWHYRQVLAWMRRTDYPTDSDVLEFFPKTLPDHATNTRMILHQLPGDMDFELRCTLPADEVAALIARVTPVAIVSGHAGDEMTGATTSAIAMRNNVSDPTYFSLADGPGMQNQLPPEYMVYVTHVGNSKDGAVKLIYESGIAVNPATNVVIYWLTSHAY